MDRNHQLQSKMNHHQNMMKFGREGIIQDWSNQQFQILIVKKDLLDVTWSLLNWRTKTSLPFVKPTKIILNPYSRQNIKKINNSQLQSSYIHTSKPLNNTTHHLQTTNFYQSPAKTQQYHFLIKIEDFTYRLNDLKLLPLCQSIYLLKQIITGFQQLYKMFGIFEPNDKMVIVNGKNKCKVWVNQNFIQNNKKSQQVNLTYNQFLNKIISIAQKHTYCTPLSQNLFKNIKEIIKKQERTSTTNRILEFIINYVKQNKIVQVNKIIVIYIKQNSNKRESFKKEEVKQHDFDVEELPINSVKCLLPFQSQDNKQISTLKEQASKFHSQNIFRNISDIGFKAPLKSYHHKLSQISQNVNPSKIKTQLHKKCHKSQRNKQRKIKKRPLSFFETRQRIQTKIVQIKNKSKNKYTDKSSYNSEKSINLSFLNNIRSTINSLSKYKSNDTNKYCKDYYIHEECDRKLIDTAENSQYIVQKGYNIHVQNNYSLQTTPRPQKDHMNINIYKNMKSNDLKKLTFGKKQNMTAKTQRKIQLFDYKPRISHYNIFQTKFQSNHKKLNNTTSGLFSDKISIKYLKESIKVQTPEVEIQKRQAKDSRFQFLINYGRQVKRSFHYEDTIQKRKQTDENESQNDKKLNNNSSIQLHFENYCESINVSKQNSQIVSPQRYERQRKNKQKDLIMQI